MARAFAPPKEICVRKKERLVLAQRPSCPRTKLIADIGCLDKARAIEVIAGIEDFVSQVFVCRGMKVVGSAPRDDIDLTGPAAPVLSIVAAGDHFEFLHGVHRRLDNIAGDIRIVVVHAVKEEVIRFLAAPIHFHRVTSI